MFAVDKRALVGYCNGMKENEQKSAFTWLGQAIYSFFGNVLFLMLCVGLIHSLYCIVRNLFHPKTRNNTLVFLGLMAIFCYLFEFADSPVYIPALFTHGATSTPPSESSAWSPWVAGSMMAGLLGLFVLMCRFAKRNTPKTGNPATPTDAPDSIIAYRVMESRLAINVAILVLIGTILLWILAGATDLIPFPGTR